MIYLDNSATTRPCAAAVAGARRAMEESWHNPSALYGPAVDAEREMASVRARIARAVGARAQDVVFTAGGTEADSLALLGSAARWRGARRVLLFAGEHPAVLGARAQLEAMGHTVQTFPAGPAGVADLDALSALLDQLCAELAIDPNAVCLTGHSMGGTGCWAVAAALPERFCCAVPLSGSIRISQENVAALSSLPVWAFVGDADEIVDPNASIRFVEALHAAGGDARVTVIPGADHFVVPQAYLNAEWDIVGWMLAQAQ